MTKKSEGIEEEAFISALKVFKINAIENLNTFS
jgi:hypothetical protein